MTQMNGWSALAAGDFEAAEAQFLEGLGSNKADSLRGLVRVRLLQKQPSEALELAHTLMTTEPTALNVAIYGEVLGANSKRKEAEDWLMRALQSEPRNGWIRAVLGEQRVRRGRWADGTADLIASMGGEAREEAFGHLAQVLVDLAEAVAVGKVKSEEALKLVNQVDAHIPGKTPAMSRFMASARRAVSTQSLVAAEDIPAMRFPGSSVGASGRATSEPAISQAAATKREKRVIDAPRPRRNPNEGHSVHVGMTSAEIDRNAIRPAIHNAPPLAKLMMEDRSANEALQASIANIGLPIWPSNHQSLDPIPTVKPKLLNFSTELLKRSEMQMTRGSIVSEILISRGVEALLGAVVQGAARQPDFDLLGLAQVEMRCLDTALEAVARISDAYNLEESEVDHATLAIGAYLGTVATRMTPAVWEFQRDVLESQVVLGDHKMQPFRAAREWLAAPDKDDAYLDYPIRRMMAASGVSPEPRQQVDTTADLKETALRLRLAEIWMGYFSRVALASQVDVSDDIRVLDAGPKVVTFGIKEKWVPAVGSGPRRIALLAGGMVPMAYVRESGEFLLLGTRQHFSRFLKHVVPSLSSETGTRCMEYFLQYHRPGSTIVGQGPRAPRLADGKKGQQVLVFWMKRGSTETGYQLVFDPKGLLRWRLEFQRD